MKFRENYSKVFPAYIFGFEQLNSGRVLTNIWQNLVSLATSLRKFFTGSKVSKYGSFSGPYFPVLGLIRRLTVSVRIQENMDQKKLRIWTLFTQVTVLVCINFHIIFHFREINVPMSHVCILAFYLRKNF